MDYRDERDALHGRVENLEQDLASARAELARQHGGTGQKRIEELERQSEEARRLLDKINGELAALRTEPEAAPMPVVAPRGGDGGARVAAFFAAWLVALGGVFLLVRSPAKPPAPRPLPPVTAPPPLPPPVDVAPVEPPPATSSTAPPPAPIAMTARWNARVTQATGRAPAAGTTCRIEAALTGLAGKIKVTEVAVVCGTARVYDSNGALGGMSMYRAGAEERGGDRPGTSTYLLQYQDTGTRAATRAQASIDSIAGSASVWSENAPAFHLDLAVPAESAPAEGVALMASVAAVLRRSATVTAVSGAGPLRVGAKCDLRVSPIADDKCIAHLACGGAVLYGKTVSSGMATCAVAEARIAHFSDVEPTSNGGDPELDVDTAAGTMVLADEIGGKRWSVTFGLEP